MGIDYTHLIDGLTTGTDWLYLDYSTLLSIKNLVTDVKYKVE